MRRFYDDQKARLGELASVEQPDWQKIAEEMHKSVYECQKEYFCWVAQPEWTFD